MSPAGKVYNPLSSPNPTSARPMSGATTRSEGNRGSRYAASLSSADSQSHFPHISQPFYLHNRHGNQDDFNFPRPDDEKEIEALFENVTRTRGLREMPNVSIEQKWHMVYNDEHIRWEEERKREDQTRKQNETGQPTSASIVENTPEWYIKKFLDKTIAAKQASSLLVSLRSKEMRYAYHKW
jgi:cytokinesis protein